MNLEECDLNFELAAWVTLGGASHRNLRGILRKFSNIPKVIISSIFDLETWGLFYLNKNSVVYDSTIKY